jgi:hypothetical protein
LRSLDDLGRRDRQLTAEIGFLGRKLRLELPASCSDHGRREPFGQLDLGAAVPART